MRPTHNNGHVMRSELSMQTHRVAQHAHTTVVSDQAAADAATIAAQGAADAAAPQAPIPVGGGRVIIDRQGDRTIITSAALPPEVMPLAQMAEETAFGLLGLLAAIIILGPFARMIARRMERRPVTDAVGENARVLQQQLRELQQSVDAMSLEVERISESQRFQSKLLYEKQAVDVRP
jgi:hypothetical protein